MLWVLVADYGMSWGWRGCTKIAEKSHTVENKQRFSRDLEWMYEIPKTNSNDQPFPQCLLVISVTLDPHTAERWTYAALLHWTSGTQRLCISPHHIWWTFLAAHQCLTQEWSHAFKRKRQHATLSCVKWCMTLLWHYSWLPSVMKQLIWRMKADDIFRTTQSSEGLMMGWTAHLHFLEKPFCLTAVGLTGSSSKQKWC